MILGVGRRVGRMEIRKQRKRNLCTSVRIILGGGTRVRNFRVSDMDLAHSTTARAANTSATGNKTKCTAKASSTTQTNAPPTTANGKTTNSPATAHSTTNKSHPYAIPSTTATGPTSRITG